jgi:cation:H+ antiporter
MSLPLIIHFALVVASCILLVKAVEWMVKSSSALAKAIRISEYTISVFIIAVATSFPELVFGITSAVKNTSLLSFGNVIGSNIADLTLIIAIPILIGGALSTSVPIRNKDLSYAGLFNLLPIIFILDGEISRKEGVWLILGYVVYLVYVINRDRGSENIIPAYSTKGWKKNTLILGFSVIMMLLSAQLLVTESLDLSALLKVPAIFIGLTFTAVGTSIPELVFGLKVIRTKLRNEVIGSVLGSVVANSTLVLGATAIISPIKKEGSVGNTSIAFLFFTLIFFFIISLSGRRISRVEAVVLLGVYCLFVYVEKTVTGL